MYLLQIHKSTDCGNDFATLNAGVTSFYSASANEFVKGDYFSLMLLRFFESSRKELSP